MKPIDKPKCDINNNSGESKAEAVVDKPPVEAVVEKPPDGAEGDENAEKIKPKQMVGLFPLDLRSELKQRVGGGKGGFSLKKSVTNVDVFNKNKSPSAPIPIKLPVSKPTDLLKSIRDREARKKSTQDGDSDDEGGQEKLSFKEKLQLIEKSSSRSLVNPL